ncbi:carbohydrate esterase family 4 protein [Chaetomium strumarium]|uniref:Carbohydrate esterase family 4 protein n=1 Tax=Chaetomium strumarium TaxID=1170767 RepID=A0AAJ0LXV0_9PEZI|nr:carbohydrate esterase family 4 protein [Chaetomium strumarium]
MMKLPAVLCAALFLSEGQAAPTTASNLTGRAQNLVPSGIIINHCTVAGVVALTFDDGPFRYTSQVLDHLDRYGARATFFVNGENWSRGIADESTPWPDILRRMDHSGHQIGSHTWSHVDLSTVAPEARYYQIRRLERALRTECLNDMQRMGYHVVNFDVDPKDYLYQRPGEIQAAMDNFSGALNAGWWGGSFLVLAHDSLPQTADALVPHMLEEIRQRGYRAVTVGECLGDPRENWYRWA